MSGLDNLARQLSTVDDTRLVAVVTQLERLRDRSSIEPLIAPARARLRQLRPQRRMTLQRLSCLPFEDVLVTVSGRAPTGRIAREAIVPCWRIMIDELPQAFSGLEGELVEAGPSQELTQKLWTHAAEALQQVLARAERDKVLQRQLQRERPQLEQELKSIYRYLATAGEIERFKTETGPAPLATLDETALERLRQSLARTLKSSGSPLHLLLVAAARSSDPEKVLEAFSGRDGEELSGLRQEASSLIGGFLFGAIENRLTTLATVTEPRRLAETLDLLLAKLDATRDLLQREYGRGAEEYAGEVEAITVRARDIVEHSLVAGAKAAVVKVFAGPGQSVPESLTATPSPEDSLRALRRSKGFATKIGAGATVTLALQWLGRQIEGRSLQAAADAGQALRQDKAAADLEDRRRQAILTLGEAARLLEISSTGAAAYTLYRRGMAHLNG